MAEGHAEVVLGAGAMHTTLYRFFDADDRLLYVGIAGRPAERTHQRRVRGSGPSAAEAR